MTISVSAYLMGENQAHTVLLCHSCISAMFQANKTDFWKKLFLTSFIKLCLTMLFAICSLKSVRDVKIHCSVTICKLFEEFFLLPISLSKIFWTLIKELQNWNCIIMVTNSLKERKIDSKKGKFGSDMFVLLCISFTVKVVIYSGV